MGLICRKKFVFMYFCNKCVVDGVVVLFVLYEGIGIYFFIIIMLFVGI